MPVAIMSCREDFKPHYRDIVRMLENATSKDLAAIAVKLVSAQDALEFILGKKAVITQYHEIDAFRAALIESSGELLAEVIERVNDENNPYNDDNLFTILCMSTLAVTLMKRSKCNGSRGLTAGSIYGIKVSSHNKSYLPFWKP